MLFSPLESYFLSTMNDCLHPCLFLLLSFPFSRTTVGYSQVCVCVCVPWSLRYCVCVCFHMLVCAPAKFHFQFCCVYPADSLQSVDKKPAMTARANVAELLKRLTERVKLMAVNPEQVFIKRTDL